MGQLPFWLWVLKLFLIYGPYYSTESRDEPTDDCGAGPGGRRRRRNRAVLSTARLAGHARTPGRRGPWRPALRRAGRAPAPVHPRRAGGRVYAGTDRRV